MGLNVNRRVAQYFPFVDAVKGKTDFSPTGKNAFPVTPSHGLESSSY